MEQDLLQQQLGEVNEQPKAMERDIQAAGGANRAALAGSPEEAKWWNREYEKLVKKQDGVLSERRELEAKVPGDAVLFRFPPLSCSFCFL
jgi:hypothetical protein